ncbi:MAG: DegT/DnrJ/EryC1/StrS family aminotransferase [Gemmatimonadales bacterium]|nr:DegT/DnrJ/EryC1/StrS family aminotransferase [Gemmatimonadales bacterium]
MDAAEFRRHGHDVIDWIADYLENSEQYPVMSSSRPGETAALIPDHAPEESEDMSTILADFRRDILPGVTHWNHPRFFAYFPANNSAPSVLGEMLSAALGVNAMLWQTSPAATELEEKMMAWLGELIGLPYGADGSQDRFHGVIQDTASTATLCALVCAREKCTAFAVNAVGAAGLAGAGALRLYCSPEAHSSVVKGAKIAGFGSENIVLVDVDESRAMDAEDLDRRITTDLTNGLIPCCVVATVGTTGTTAIDPLERIGPVARRHGLWLHVDAALAGSAAILPEKRWILNGVEHADSFVFNPHKWLFTNFDCSAYFVKDPEHLERTMAINPDYLQTDRDREVRNFRDWGIPLGRRFRALKLWFVLRNFGARRLREKIAGHIALAEEFSGWVEAEPDWELMAPVPLNTVCFRHRPTAWSETECNERNKDLMDRVNAAGRIYLTHTTLDGRFTLRVAIGQTQTEREHVVEAWEVLREACNQ